MSARNKNYPWQPCFFDRSIQNEEFLLVTSHTFAPSNKSLGPEVSNLSQSEPRIAHGGHDFCQINTKEDFSRGSHKHH